MWVDVTDMVVVRNVISTVRAGGPRQLSEIRSEFMVEITDFQAVDDVLSELDSIGLDGRSFNNIPLIKAEPQETISEVISSVSNFVRNIPEEGALMDLSRADGVVETTSNIIESTRGVLSYISDLAGVVSVSFVRTLSDFGPENLRASPFEMRTLTEDDYHIEDSTQGELMSNLEMERVWNMTEGENAIIAVFDTGYAEGLISENRIVGEFHGGDTNSVYAPEEAHGAMVVGAAAANADDGVPYDGIAKGSDIIYVRITDDSGAIRTDIINEGWDWLLERDGDRPIVTNHSYGMPICNSRPRFNECQSPDADAVRLANSTPYMTSVYAAGNEAGTCGRRLSGLTSGITGINSLAEVITVGALRFDMLDGQRYTSHGRGDCSPISDPKPNVSCALPQKLYSSDEDGWKVKDMGAPFGGSFGGTSTASPYVAGKIALLQSKAMDRRGEPLQTEELKQIIHKAAEPPRRTQVNSLPGITARGWDARFGHGQINILEALREV